MPEYKDDNERDLDYAAVICERNDMKMVSKDDVALQPSTISRLLVRLGTLESIMSNYPPPFTGEAADIAYDVQDIIRIIESEMGK